METTLQKQLQILALAFFLFANNWESKATNFMPSYDKKFYNILMGKGLPKNGNRWPVSKGSVWMGITLSQKLSVYPRFGTVSGWPIMAWGEYSYSDHNAIGGYAGYYQGQYQVEYGVDMYESRLKSFVGGVRWTFHFADLFNRAFLEVVNLKKVDIYTTLHAGFVQYQWEVDSRYQFHKDYAPVNKPSAGAVLGIRILPHPKLGIHLEGGKGVFGYFNFGVNYKIVN